jgi:ABC-type multidrug transport system ATPase subunit
VTVGGIEAADPRARRVRRVCRTQPALFPRMTVADHLHVAARATATPVAHAVARADALGLGPWREATATTLSTGNARKLWYVMCTLGDFEVACLDEPFLGLDEDGVQVVCREIADWAATAAVVLAGHDLPDRLAVHHRFDLGSGPDREEDPWQ